MKPTLKPFAIKMVFCVSFLFLFLFLTHNVFAASTIEGIVFDKQRNALPDIDVELLNDYYQTIQRTRTDGSGRYRFTGLNNGRYTVKAYAFRYDYQDQEIPVEVNTQSGLRGSDSGTTATQGSGYFMQDFYLVPKKGGLRDSGLGVVFVQEIPKEAEAAYKKANEEFAKKRTAEGITALAEAVKLFRDYHDAWYLLGKEAFINKKYVESVRYFLEVVKINPKNAHAYYYIGLGLNYLGKEYNKSALAALNEAHTLAPASVPVVYTLGKVERQLGKFVEAEKHLLEAKKLSTAKVAEIHEELYHLYSDDLKKYKEAADELELFLKASKLSDDDEKKVRKAIADLRAKATAPATN